MGVMSGMNIKISISIYLLSTESKMNDFSELDDWDPMAEDFYNPVFNSYKDVQKSITHDLSKLYIRNIPKDYTEEQLLSLMSEGNRRVRHICLFPAKKYESTTAGIVGFYTEKMAEEAMKLFSDHYLNFRIEYATRKMTEKVMLKQIQLWMPVQENKKVNPSQAKKADLPQSKKINLPQSTKANLPQSMKVNLPQSAKGNLPQSTKGNLPQSTKVNLPQSEKGNLPQSKKAFKDEDECKENLQPNQPPVKPLSSKPLLCRICGNQIGAFTFSDSRGKYCTNSCRRQSLLELARKVEAEKLNKINEKTATCDQSVEKTVPSIQSDKEKPAASDPISKTKEPGCVEKMTEEESYYSMVEENRRRRQYIRKYMAELTAEDREKTQKQLELVNSSEFKRSRVERFIRSS